MSIRSLEQEIKKRILQAIKDAQLVDVAGVTVTPIVETGILPGDVIKGSPYILIQTTDIKDDDLESEVEVLLVYGTVGMGKKDRIDKEKSNYVHATGHWDVISLVDKIRSNFLKDVNFDFGILKRKMEHKIYGQVDDVNYIGDSKLKFEISTIAPEYTDI